MQAIATERYARTRALFERGLKVIPGGIPGHLGPVQSQFIPVDSYLFYVERAKGSRFWDVDGNEFIDYMCAFGPNVLGYNNELVDQAAARQSQLGNCMPMPGEIQVELAELLVETIEIADWAFFAKNGNDVTSLAVMAARAHTGKTKTVLFKGGYHGVAPWTQKHGRPGITREDLANNIYVKWNDLEGLENVIRRQKDEIACLMATPYHHPIFEDNALPAPGFWQEVERLCRANDIVLAVDDVRAGFRLDLAGSAHYFGFTPDLAAYCKAIGNGYAISALVGRDELRSAVTDVFYTGSYWSSAVPMAAAAATVRELHRLDGANLMLRLGSALTEGLRERAGDHGIRLRISGAPSMFYMSIPSDDSLRSMQTFSSECARRGVFFTSHHNHFINCSLTDDDIARTLEVADEAFDVVAKTHPKATQGE
jgi:glutamate-1-semialdehyde 2,1-aminomutase